MINVTFCIVGIIGLLPKNISNDEVDDGEGESANDEADDSIENGVFGFFNLGGIAGGSHVINAADYNEDDGNEAGDKNDGIENPDDDRW